MSVDVLDPAKKVAERASRLTSSAPDWLRSRRHDALERYLSAPLPERPRTPLRPRRLDAIPVWEPGAAPMTTDALPEEARGASVVVTNGRLALGELPPSWRDAGVSVVPLETPGDADQLLVARHLGSGRGDGTTERFTALNDALWSGGVLIHVPRGVRLTEPLTVLEWVGADAGGVFPRVLLAADQASECSVVELLAGAPADAHRVLVSSVVEVVAGPAAVVRYSAIQQLPPGAEAFLRRDAVVARDAVVEWNTVEFGAALSVSGHRAVLGEPGGRMKSVTVFFGSGGQHQDYTAAVEHVGPHTASDILARGVMRDRARSIFTGESAIRKGAVRTDARQKEQTLMLSDSARADAIPSLIIEDNDVFASHSASAGPVEAGVLYYLESRGIPEREAERLVVHGFLEPVVSQIHLPTVRDWVRRLVDVKLGWV